MREKKAVLPCPSLAKKDQEKRRFRE